MLSEERVARTRVSSFVCLSVLGIALNLGVFVVSGDGFFALGGLSTGLGGIGGGNSAAKTLSLGVVAGRVELAILGRKGRFDAKNVLRFFVFAGTGRGCVEAIMNDGLRVIQGDIKGIQMSLQEINRNRRAAKR